MKILIENLNSGKTKTGRQYFVFWVRFFDIEDAVSVSGWKYYPDKKTLSTPSYMKEKDRFFNTVKIKSAMYNKILEEAERYLTVLGDMYEENTSEGNEKES